MDFRKLPPVQLALVGLSVFTLLLGLITLVVRGGGGGTPSAGSTPTAGVSAGATPKPTTTVAGPDLAIAAKPKPLHPVKASAPIPPGVATAIGGLLDVPALGPGVKASVVDVMTGKSLFAVGATSAAQPASTAKLATAAAALSALGPSAVLTTSTFTGATPGQVVLVGGGDPTLSGAHPEPAGSYPATASLAALAKATSKSLAGKTVTVGYDETLYTGPKTAPGWKPSYITSGNVAPVVSLMVDEGRTSAASSAARNTNPALVAAQQFAVLLSHDGVKVSGTPKPGLAVAGSKPLASVTSAPVSALVERMLRISDNDLAESLARQVAIKLKKPPTFAGGAQAVSLQLAKLGIDSATMQMVDGSGLSTQDRLQAATLVAVLRATASGGRPELRSVLTGLPVAGFLGTLSGRFVTTQTAVGIGAVRAKTGTLTNVSSLSGVVVDVDGRQLAFALIAGNVPAGSTLGAEAALDRVAATLAGCGCR